MRQVGKLLSLAAVGAMVTGVMVGVTATSASADSATINFDDFTAGVSPNGQVGWSMTGPYDSQIVLNSGAPAAFGTQSLRISNGFADGAFGGQTFSKSLTDSAGEATADGGTYAGGGRQSHFETQWQFTSATPGAYQPDLAVSASPDRGDGARMSYVRMVDTAVGLSVFFDDYRDEHPVGSAVGDPAGCTDGQDDFFETTVASRLDRATEHTIKLTMDFLPGPRNDVVRVWVDGVLVHTGTSWEDYFRFCEGNPTRPVDSMIFAARGSSVTANLGKGFLIDNLTMSSGPPVTAASTGTWELSPAQASSVVRNTTSTTAYQASVRSPINADGSSNFPKRRGVIPVQFDLSSSTRTVVTETTTVSPLRFESIVSDNDPANDYSYLSFTPSQTVKFADINTLIANYTFTTGNCGAGSLRWSVEVGGKNAFIYFGVAPNFSECNSPTSSGDNLIGNSDARFDLTKLGGPFYGTYADALDMIGNEPVTHVSLVLDSGNQALTLGAVNVDGAIFTPTPDGVTSTTISDTTTPMAKTCTLPQALIKVSKTDGLPTGDINEPDSIQPKDIGLHYRVVDCKYLYNMDVSSLDANLSTRQGTYRVWVNIGGTNIPNPAVFDLR